MTDQTCVVGEMAKCDSPECGKDVALGYLGSSGAVQFAGVLATTCGFFVFLSWHWEGLVKDQGDRMRQILLMGWPVILAFCIVGLSLAMMCVSFIRTPQRSLRWVFWGVLLPDTLLLGALVWNTGGPSESVFTPIFLLIPAVATSYCHPGKRFFISLLVAVVGVYVAGAYLESIDTLPKVTEDFLRRASAAGGASSPESSGADLAAANAASGLASTTSTTSTLVAAGTKRAATKSHLYFTSAVFTVLCILTAWGCSFWTRHIRSQFCCSGCDRTPGDRDRPDKCDKLYL